MKNTFSQKEITLSSGKKIFVFDNLITHYKMSLLFSYIMNSKYSFNGCSSPFHLGDKQYLQCIFGPEDLKNFGILDDTVNDIIGPHVENLKPVRSYFFVSDHTTKHYYHCDSGVMTFLYYPVLEWQPEYGGETQFADDSVSEIEYTSMYKPGRIILFDSKIPHRMSSPSSHCPHHRVTFVINWDWA
jgi:hypothetical protein